MPNVRVVFDLLKKQSFIGWLASFAVVLMATLSAKSAANAQDIWRTNNGLVKIVDAERTASNQHPVAFSESDIYFALRAIRVQRKGSFSVISRARGNKKTTSLFQDSNARLLTPYLVQAFRESGKSQDVFFSLKSDRGAAGQQILSSSSVVTSGRIFFKGNHLNIIFGSALNDAGKATGAVGSNANRYAIRATAKSLQGKVGSRRSQARIAVAIQPTQSVRLARVNSKVRSDWAVVALDSAVQAGASQIGTNRQPAANSQGVVTSAPVRSTSNRSAEDQLAKLKSLRDKGLVTEEAYQAQILKILDRSL
ncbi:MAG: SHOCT domain-containing protein [Hyphomicrobiales bacterium]